MKTHKLTPEERFDLVMECRSSGMTGYQRCKEYGIGTGTLYRWIALFRKNGLPDVPVNRISRNNTAQIGMEKYEKNPFDLPRHMACGIRIAVNDGYLQGNSVTCATCEPPEIISMRVQHIQITQ